MQHVIIGNFGNHSLAVMQDLLERALPELHFVCVDTGWTATAWSERVLACSNYARNQGVKVHWLRAQTSFPDMVRDRKQFPSHKFQWCASFLKGLTILNFLDDFDPACEALIVSGKRRCDSRRYANLQEFEKEDELYQGRTIWHPLWQMNNHEFAELIKRTGFNLLPHQSLECSPCIHSQTRELAHLDEQSIMRLETLEQAIGQSMYKAPIRVQCTTSEDSERLDSLDLQQFDRGCGAAWGCGE
ncbi:Phosphoadenosine phosphosulfate reductase family protein [Legionella nautarum]|uniref:Phosphoadenosine phosphosulfate reductase family protein n=1 Tax=Legionella nautarum TaxID=45070 RepID=A0A0W0WKX9_9GAMM|nr:phosphoadenosine phosphosulfate reductase family protein [Legionella nautarum]KTD32961.1 Phosphoadenosine phosphosulfate reductase family protein [Legionella nautarum]